MTAGSPGLMGVLLIVIGLAFALLAVAVMLNRRDAQAEAEASADELEGPEPEAGERDDGDLPEPAALQGAEPAHQEAKPIEPEPLEAEPAEEVVGQRATARPEAAQPESAAVEPPAPSPRALLPVAELLREEVTGRLMLRLGDRLIRSPEDLDSEADRRKLQYASADLAEWFRDLEKPSARPGAGPARRGQRAKAPSPDAPLPDQAVESTAAEPAGAQPRSMIEAINAILDRRLESTEGAARAVRLVPDPSGGVLVLVGMKTYPMEQVPDESIREVIRQAVAEWEEGQ